jgi:hypothetical protein
MITAGRLRFAWQTAFRVGVSGGYVREATEALTSPVVDDEPQQSGMPFHRSGLRRAVATNHWPDPLRPMAMLHHAFHRFPMPFCGAVSAP